MKNIAIALLIFLSACSYSDGDRVGQVTKLSRKGFIFKTYEGELATLAKGKAATMISNSFSFSVIDKKVADKIKEAMEIDATVSLHYEQQFFVFPWEGDTDYFITEVTIIKNK